MRVSNEFTYSRTANLSRYMYICMCMYFNDQKKVLLKLTQYLIFKQVHEVFLSVQYDWNKLC